MLYKSLKLFRPATGLIIPQKGIDGKNICLGIFGENVTFREVYNRLNINPSYIKHVFVPRVTKPIKSWLTPDYRKILINFRLRPVSSVYGDYEGVTGFNFYLDYTYHIEQLLKRFSIKQFNTLRANSIISGVLDTLGSVSNIEYEKTLLYCLNVNNSISTKIQYRRFFVIYNMILKWMKDPVKNTLPFDKLIVFIYESSVQGQYILIFDKSSSNNNISRIRNFLMTMRMSDEKLSFENEVDETTDEVISKSTIVTTIPETKKQYIKSAVNQYIKDNPIILNNNDTTKFNEKFSTSKKKTEYFNNLVNTSILYHNYGRDLSKVYSVVKKVNELPEDKQKKFVEKNDEYLLPRLDIKPVSTNPFVYAAKPDLLVDKQNPKHIFEKRKSDFKENLQQDIVDAFKTLEKKSLPLKLKKMSIKTIQDPASELYPSIKDRYTLELVDEKDETHTIMVDLPHLTENGTFIINGINKVLINQIITYPIFFFKPYDGSFTSSYSTVRVNSKILRKASYLILYMSGYKVPLLLYMAYKLGFDNALKLFDITYTLSDEKVPNGIPLPNGKYLVYMAKDESGRQFMNSLLYSLPNLPKENFDLNNTKTWRYALEKEIGNKNCTYTMDQVWSNIVTPIEIKILESRGDPTDIKDIIRLISKDVVFGKVDDRNGLEKQRIRTSEMFISQLQKQIYMAYNEYEAKRFAGDDTAKYYINSTKVYQDIAGPDSQNVQMLENINPLEELSMMTRITPVGIGGVPTKDAYPAKAMNLHPSYFGNIDPFETPDAAGIGVIQQLTVGADISNIRGMFGIKEWDKVPPTALLSPVVSMIPFVESNEGTRICQASGQAKQAIPLENPEMPAVQTGYESYLTPLLSDSFIKKSPVNGIVKSISNNLIIITDAETGKDFPVDVTPKILRSGQGKNGLGKFKPIVDIGQKVKKEDIIAEGANIVDGMISNGVNMLVGFMPWKGYNFEDGMVVSETAAKKFSSLHVESQQVYIKPEEDVEFIANMGDTLNKGDILITYSEALYDIESKKHLRSDGGTIVNIEIYSNVPEENIPEKLIPLYKEFKDKYIKLRGSYPIGSFREKREPVIGILVKFVIQQTLSLKKGDKLNNRHFNKGVVAIIEKDENMPVTPWGERLDMIYNNLAILNRMNSGQLCEMHAGLISKKLGKLMLEKSRAEFTSMFQSVLTVLDGTDGKLYSSNILQFIKSLSDIAYNRLKSKVEKTSFIPLLFPGFKSPSRQNVLRALSLIGLKPRYSLVLPEYGKKTDPVGVGVLYVVKLEHISEKKISARSTGGYVSKTQAPVAGKKRGGAQKIGENDLYALLAWDCPTIIDELYGPLSSDHITKNEMISEIIHSGETTFRIAKTNPVKELYSNMMLAIHLEMF